MKSLGMEDPASSYDPLFWDSFADPDSELLHRDPEAESVRSHPSSHADQALLPHAMPSFAPRPQTQRLQRRRSRYLYVNGVLVPATSPSPFPHQPSNPAANWPTPPGPAANQTLSHKRSKSYGVSGNPSSWLLGSASAFADPKRQTWTGERREVRKLQKDHPVGSARPGFTIAIGNNDGRPRGAPEIVVEKDGAKGSVLGVRRKMEKLKGLYRRTSKETFMPPNLR